MDVVRGKEKDKIEGLDEESGKIVVSGKERWDKSRNRNNKKEGRYDDDIDQGC